jgi:phosphate transport system substrate-binding protein
MTGRLRRSLARGMAAVGVTASLLAGSASAASADATVSGTGSSYAAIAINAWVSQIYTTLGTNVNYQSSSSVLGLENFAQNLVDFGASEIGYSAGQTQSNPPSGYQYLPSVAGAVCLMYNVLGSTGQQVNQLRLSPAVIGGMFTGTIRKWNDPAITSLNPTALLPNTPLVVTFRADASGDNYIFSSYIQNTQPAVWAGFTGAMGARNGPSAVWPTPATGGNSAGQYNEGSWVSQNGSDNASNYVASSLNTITYVETGYAQEHNMPCAYVQNAAGNFVSPSAVSDARALTHDTINIATGEQDLSGVFNAPEADAYSISAYSYLVTQTSGMSPDKGKALSQFVLFLACQGQQSASRLGYTPLPPELIALDFAAASKMNGHVPVPSEINAQTCPNPIVTGEFANVGGPPILGAPTDGQAPVVIGGGASGASGGGTTAKAAKSSVLGSTSKVAGGSLAAAGQTPGVALVAASNRLLGLSGPTGSMLMWTLGFVLVLAIPLALLALSRRRLARSSLTDDQLDDDAAANEDEEKIDA